MIDTKNVKGIAEEYLNNLSLDWAHNNNLPQQKQLTFIITYFIKIKNSAMKKQQNQ